MAGSREALYGDLLTATLWGYFANHAILGALSQPQANMIDRPGLSYGLFHLHAQPIKLYGTLTTRVEFKGLNLDIGHLRALRWSQTNDPVAWVSYNRMRGQQASALEHATPEAFWVDRKQCRYIDENGQTINPTLADCPQAVSAVKAIAIAARQGQKIYTITQKNAATALPQLTVNRTIAAEIKNAIAAGKEVTVHEKAINAYGFSGVGYIIVDPETGSGAYLIEGGGSGSWIIGAIIGISIGMLIYATFTPTFQPQLVADMAEMLSVILLSVITLLSLFSIFDSIQGKDQISIDCFIGGFLFGFGLVGTSLGFSKVPLNNQVKDALVALSIVILIGSQVGMPTGKPLSQCRP